jgi:putative cell wall-binding protein
MTKIVDEECGDESSEWAIIARGDMPADALGASALAGVLDCPVLITSPSDNTLNANAKSELIKLNVKHVILLSGPTVIKSSVEADIQSAIGKSGTIERIYGETREQTALLIEKRILEIASERGESASTTCFVTKGWDTTARKNNTTENMPDALAAAPYASATGSPIFLTNGDGELSKDTLAAIKSHGYTKVFIAGGEQAVAASVEKSLKASGLEVERVSGETRYQTAVQLANVGIRDGVLEPGTVALATGTNFADALVSSTLLGRFKGVLLLVAEGSNNYSDAMNYLSANKESIYNAYFLGGTASISNNIRELASSATGLPIKK